jgi:hypothetical protein
MKYLLFYLSISLSFSSTSCPHEFSLSGVKGMTQFCISPEKHVVSKLCFEDKKCEWKTIQEKIKKLEPTEKELRGGKNPTSKKCDLAGFRVAIFRDVDGNEQSFCEIKPDAYISNSSF